VIKNTILAVLLIASLVGGATIFGIGRSGASGRPQPETETKLALAERFVESEPTRALQVMDDLAAAGARTGERGALIHVRALDKAGRFADAVAAADKFLKDFPNSASRTEVELTKISSMLAQGGAGNPTLRADAERFVAQHAGRPEAQRIQVALARQELQAGDFSGAQKRLRPLLETARLDDPEVFAVADMLGRANLERLLSGGSQPGDQVHEVRSGESINAIARRNGLTDELLMMANGISDPRRLRVGQRLRVPSVDFSLVADLGSNTMVLKNHGEFFKIYRVRTGREEGATPTGTFRVLNKKRSPTWRPGNGHVYGPDDPNNELGTRWMAFEGDILGIHGTLHPETIGEYASNGCIGMLTQEVEELFDLITVGTPLIIKGERDLTRHRVIPAPRVPPPREVASR
jgi:LysM repeat protein